SYAIHVIFFLSRDTYTLSLHDALPISDGSLNLRGQIVRGVRVMVRGHRCGQGPTPYRQVVARSWQQIRWSAQLGLLVPDGSRVTYRKPEQWSELPESVLADSLLGVCLQLPDPVVRQVLDPGW